MYFIKKYGLENIYKTDYQSSSSLKEPEGYLDLTLTLFPDRLEFFSNYESIQEPVFRNRRIQISLEFAHADEIDHLLLNILEYFTQYNFFRGKIGQFQELVPWIPYTEYFQNKGVFIAEVESGTKKLKVKFIEIFFCFLEDLFNSRSDICQHNPEYCSHYREVLSGSKVFEYLNKKRLFCKAVYEYIEAGEPPGVDNYFHFELKKAYLEYSELLLKDEMLHHIPAEKLEANNWILGNPEIELIHVRNMFGELLAQEQLNTEQIENFLLKKHNIFNAINFKKHKWFSLFYIFQLIALFLSIGWLLSIWSRNYDTESKFIYLVFFGGMMGGSLLVSFIYKKKLKFLFPRLIISIITGSLISISLFDFISSMMMASNFIIFIICTIITFLVAIAILMEIKTHSRYYKIVSLSSITKGLVIFIYTFNLSFLLTVLLHVSISGDNIDKSNIFPKVILNNEFHIKDEVDKYNYYINKFVRIIEDKEPASILEFKDFNSIVQPTDQDKFKNCFLRPIRPDTTKIGDLREILFLNKHSTYLISFNNSSFKIFYRMFVIQLFIAIGVAIIGQTFLYKETITEPY